jgi:putative aldouronate transport system permease protein
VAYLPHFFSWVLVVTFFVQMLGGAGLLAQELRQHGLAPWDVMTDPRTFIVLVTAEAVWKDVGWGTIVFLAALAAIDPTLYEAAAADGAGRARRLWHITLPGLRPVIVLLAILRLGDALSVGFEQFILQREAVGRQAAEVLDTFVYYQAIVPQEWGVGAAAGLFKGVVGLVLIVLSNKIAHRLGEQGVYSKA